MDSVAVVNLTTTTSTLFEPILHYSSAQLKVLSHDVVVSPTNQLQHSANVSMISVVAIAIRLWWWNYLWSVVSVVEGHLCGCFLLHLPLA